MYSSPLTRFKDLFVVHQENLPTGSQLSRRPSGRLSPLKSPGSKSAAGLAERQIAEKSFSEVLPKILDYLSKTRLDDDFNELLYELLTQPLLPHNPYPWLVQRMTSRNERWLLEMKFRKSQSILQSIPNEKQFEIASRLSAAIVRPHGCSFVWGLPVVVSMVNGAEIWRYLWLLKEITPAPEKHDLPTDYTCQVIPAIIGPTVFYDSVYKYPYSVEFKFEFIVAGYDVRQAVKIFLREILNDVRDVEANPLHILLRIYVPVKENEIWMNRMWIFSDVVNREIEMMTLLEEAVNNRRPIVSECLFSLDQEGSFYVHGQKHYVLTVVKISGRVKEEDRVIHFTDAPFGTLYEGIFTRQSHVESYLTVYRDDFVEEQPPEVENETIAGTANEHGEPNFTSSSTRPQNSQHRHGKVSYQRNGNGDINIDGFRTEFDGYDADCAEVKDAIRLSKQKHLMSLDLDTEPWLVLHNLLLLELLEGRRTSELLSELTRAANSRAAQLYSLMHLNRSLRELIYKFEAVNLQNVPMSILVSMLKEYKRNVLKFFDDQGASESSLLFSCRAAILQRLNSLDKWTEGTRAVTMEALKFIKDLHSYMYSLYLIFVGTMLDLCPSVKDFIKSMKSQTSVEPQTADLSNENQVNLEKLELSTSDVRFFKHGLEDDRIMKNDDRVIDVELCICNSHARSAIDAKQLVLMKYIVDTHLDQVWSGFLTELLSRDKFPDNPCNQLISFLRQGSMKVDLCFESPQATFSNIRSLLHVDKTDVNKYIWHIRQYSVYGLQSILGVMDPISLQPTLHSVSPLFQKNFRFQEGPYKVAICTAVCGNTVLYGRLDPYLPLIQLNEYCFIQGPKGCSTEAMQLYIRITFEEILSKYKANEYILDGVSFAGKLWGIDEIIYKKKGFALQMEQSLKSLESVCFKLFVLDEWRLVPVVKHLLFNYIVETEPKNEQFYPENRYNLYQNVFLEADRAAFHLQFLGPPNRGDPFQSFNMKLAVDDLDRDISLRIQRSDWLEVCRLVFWRSQITTKSSSVLVEVYRALHSVARRLDYVISLGFALQDLVRNVMMSEEHEYFLEIGERKLKEMTRQPRHIDPKKQDSIMIQMLKAFKRKASEVCNEDRCLVPSGVVTAVMAKIDSLIEKDDDETEGYLVTIGLKSIIVLDEILQMLSMLRDSLSYDFLLSSSGMLDELRSINAEFVPKNISINTL